MTFDRLAAPLAMALCLSAFALFVPQINAGGGPPRSVFLQLPDEAPTPDVQLTAVPAKDGEWFVTITASDFRFTTLCLPEAEPVPLGHAHIIVDGQKVASAYHPVVKLGVLAPGQRHIQAVLRGQDHRALLGRQGMIKADIFVTVPKA
ncbi:hypothetical protein [Actibacterium lipolyticum]|uniref:DUF4399 domain-containing protein n=1 Tax=Actibacterium lipolyticum TaxID=1524263 RepID=A0A238JQ62_9RHOB|nr:hypothetical protein [Actibacterium lipolyticum]SMX31992.1 hypothetical protein COL8621_00675 [Actibacterium lipolyticum]